MDNTIFLEVLTSAPVLFFLLGIVARLIRSDLDIPYPLPKLFSIYVLLAIGIKGGVHFIHTPLSMSDLWILLVAVAGGGLLTLSGFFVFQKTTTHANAIALSASYGSISAVTFITAAALLDRLSLSYAPVMVAAMALMESPAILVAAFLHKRQEDKGSEPLLRTLHHAMTNSSVVLLLGAFVIGLCLSNDGWEKVSPFFDGLFYGLLSLFLLDLGLSAAKKIGQVVDAPKRLFGLALLLPLVHAMIGLGFSVLLGLSPGSSLLLMLLFGSASYIAAPAAMRSIVPDANPGLYLSLALGITFPFNILVGIPVYLWLVTWIGGS